MDMTLRENVTLPSLSDHARHLRLISKSSERQRVRELISSLSIRATGTEQPVATLSGGNQQKVVLAKWLSHTLDVLIFDEPTQGVDIQAKEEIFAEIRLVANRGKAVIFISSDFAELVPMCNRVIVLREGHLTGEVSAPNISEEAMTRLAYAEYAAY
jgi:ribose transport system ATP-binding protein